MGVCVHLCVSVLLLLFYVLELEATEFGYLGLGNEEWASNTTPKCPTKRMVGLSLGAQEEKQIL